MPFYSRRELDTLIYKCLNICNHVSDNQNFVTVKKLAESFNAEIVLRPLLVEAMLASINTKQKNTDKKWSVLINSERYPDITHDDIDNESITSPLPLRLRNTIAHELVHTFAFNTNGVDKFKLTKNRRSSIQKNKFVEDIEKDTEGLSPLLLISNKYIDSFFYPSKEETFIDDLKEITNKNSVSRYVLVNKLRQLITSQDELIFSRNSLKNIAIGIGIWVNSKEAKLKRWPLYINFDNNRLPNFLLNHDKNEIVIPDTAKKGSFILYGGTDISCTFTEYAGTKLRPNLKKLIITFSVEKNAQKKSSEFFFIFKSQNP